MRAYEFAKKVGIDYGSVVQLAEDNGIEIYSPLTQFEADEAETLHAAYLRADRTAYAARLAAIVEKRHARAVQISKARAAEARRRRALTTWRSLWWSRRPRWRSRRR